MLRRPRVSTLFPYTTLFRSDWAREFGATIHLAAADREWVMRPDPSISFWSGSLEPVPGVKIIQTGGHFEGAAVLRSEEHTSELQSRQYLVCRLLLEKKKKGQ